MNTYVVTARNHYFWQRLAVKARNIYAAENKFAKYLASRSSQREEAYEWSEGEKLGADERCPRSHYTYEFNAAAIEEPDCTDRIDHIGVVVSMIGSGGNG